MSIKIFFTLCVMCILGMIVGAPLPSVAEDDHMSIKWFQKISDHDDEDGYGRRMEHRERHHERRRERDHERNGDRDHGGHALKKVNNSMYKKECGACHFAYQPELLPSASWLKILENLDDHFGEAVDLGDDTKNEISQYVKSNSAENSSSKRAVKIMRSLGKQVPARITDIRYIREKHHEITSDILKRKTIGSLSNCSACHTNAVNGHYDDDHVRIPR